MDCEEQSAIYQKLKNNGSSISKYSYYIFFIYYYKVFNNLITKGFKELPEWKESGVIGFSLSTITGRSRPSSPKERSVTSPVEETKSNKKSNM